MMLLEDFPDFSLWHDPAYCCLYAAWRGFHGNRRTQKRYLLLHEHVQRTGSTKLLNDSLLDEDGWSQVADWVAEEGFVRLAAAGLQSVAWVLPRQPAAFYDTARVLTRLQGLLVDTFADAQAAYEWLHRWPQVPTTPPATGSLPSREAFVLLPPAQQLTLAASQGYGLVPRWEDEFYITPYQVPNGLLVEACYHMHSGQLHHVQTRPHP